MAPVPSIPTVDSEPDFGEKPFVDDPAYRSRRSDSSSRRRPPSRRRTKGRPRKRVWFPLLALLFLSPAIFSWAKYVTRPTSLPLWPNSVEWVREHHGNWLVDEVEKYNALWFHQPQKGGPGLKNCDNLTVTVDTTQCFPSVGIGGNGGHHHPKHHKKDYRPPNIKPIFTYALPGEGVWKPTGPPVDGGPPVLVTTFRSETIYPQIVAYVAWFDHTRTASAYYPGRYEPPSATLRGPMMVPYSQRWRLLATFNGGFIYNDGLNGDAVNGVTNEPMKYGNATVVAYKNGTVDIISWHGGSTVGRSIAWARQSLPPIVENGKRNPALDLSTDWGYTLGNAVRVWRTGLGIDRHGNLIYVAASDQTVISLADILIHAGAVRGMELDINPEWYTIITYHHKHGLVPTQLAVNYQQQDSRYLTPDDRDFFAIYRRKPEPVNVPLK
jgi:hypothetical protein